MTLSSPMTWIRVSVIVQLVGLAIDGVWHGLLEPGAEPDTFDQMLVLYLGIIGLFASTAWALVDRARRGTVGLALPVAFTGALIQTVAETWHAWMHLRLRPGPIPEAFALGGLVVAIAALLAARRGVARSVRDDVSRRPAA